MKTKTRTDSALGQDAKADVAPVFLGLGSNVGDRLSYLRAASDLLTRSEGLTFVRASKVYETEPVGEVGDQRTFFNAVVEVACQLAPLELLALAKGVESRLGRGTSTRHGPREIDVDILLFGDLVATLADSVSGRVLELPHPTLTERRFVLVPLLELKPDLVDPFGRRLSDVLVALGSGQWVHEVGVLDPELAEA